LKASQAQNFQELRQRFAAHGQEHVFRFFDRLGPAEREDLLRQAARIDLPALDAMITATRAHTTPGRLRLEPAPIERLPERGGDPAARRAAAERGEALLRAGRVAALVVAGGQGTRLGFPGPKGAFPIGPVTDRSLFELQAQRLRGARRRYGAAIPWCVMTSPATDAATHEFFERQSFFGLPKEDVFFFCQQKVPALDFTGKLLLETTSCIAESPNGHGGSFTALRDSGTLDRLEERGVTLLSYYQVDNPLAVILDPVYLGFHDLRGAEMSCKVIEKRDPMEKMGVVARIEGRVGIVEYTEIDDVHRHLRDAGGGLVYWAGSTGIHVLSTGFVQRVAVDADRTLPYHATAKKIPTVDAEGRPVEPETPNGHKLERFVFDALPAARAVAVVEVHRHEEYSPVKNADGPDSPATARRDLSARCRDWLAAAGASCPPPGVLLEVDHSVLDGAEDARRLGIRDAAAAAPVVRVAREGSGAR
jgi:UDP-N-acetylglucosamine/UDP-N-acetylgalactosamine diphosphorylase